MKKVCVIEITTFFRFIFINNLAVLSVDINGFWFFSVQNRVKLNLFSC